MKRWKREKRRMATVQVHRATRREERIEVYRDKDSGLVLQRWGADRGPPERKDRRGGWTVSSDKIFALLGPAYAVMPGPVEILLMGGALGTATGKDGADVIRRRLDAARELRQVATTAGVQRRLSGRYDVGQPGRDASAEEHPRVTRARRTITQLAERISWPVLGLLLEICLFEREIAPRVDPGPEPERRFSPEWCDWARVREAAIRWDATWLHIAPVFDLLADQFRLMPAMVEA